MNQYPKIEEWKISDIYADYDNNPRILDEDKNKALEKSIEEFGNIQPIVVNARTGKLLSGHQRLNILRKNEEKVQVWAVDIDEFKENSASIALNNEVGEFDDYELSKIIKELNSENVELTGFAPHEISRVIEDIDTTLEEGSEEISEKMDIYKISLEFSSLDNKFRWEKFIEKCKMESEYNRPVTDYMFKLMQQIIK